MIKAVILASKQRQPYGVRDEARNGIPFYHYSPMVSYRGALKERWERSEIRLIVDGMQLTIEAGADKIPLQELIEQGFVFTNYPLSEMVGTDEGIHRIVGTANHEGLHHKSASEPPKSMSDEERKSDFEPFPKSMSDEERDVIRKRLELRKILRG